MKNLKKAIFPIFIIAILGSCATPGEKVEKAEENVMEANNKLDSAIKNYQNDVNAYRIETANRVALNEKSIKDFNLRIANEKNEARIKYLKKIVELENKNTDLKKRMEDYKADSREKWGTFKSEFNKEMDDLGKSIKDLTTKD